MKIIKSVNQLASLIRGIAYKPEEASTSFVENYVPIIKTNNIQDGLLTFLDMIYVNPKQIKEMQKLRKGDVLIAASTGSKKIIGKAAPVKFDWNGSFGAFCLVLRPNKAIINADYFGYYFQSKYYRAAISHMSSGANINNLKREYFDTLQIPIPSLDDQKRIVKILDEADALRQKRKQTIKLLDDYLKSVFLEMFGDPVKNPKGWSVKKLGDLAKEFKYGTNTISDNEDLGNKMPILRIPNVVGEKINYTDLKYSIIDEKEKEKIKLEMGDLLFVRTNGNPAYIGRCAVFCDSIECGYASYLIRVRLNDDSPVDANFVRDAVSFPTYSRLVITKAKTTAGNYNINTESLKSLNIYLPPRLLQKQFAFIAQRTEFIKQIMLIQLKELETQFQALMQKAFKGELCK